MVGQRTSLRTALVTAALVLGCVSESSEGLLTDVLVLTELDPKVLPLAIDADADPKDTLYKARVAYKPATAVLFPETKDFRLLLRGKRDGAALRAVLQRDFLATGYELHLRVAFDPDKTAGLVDGASLAFFELLLDTAVEGTPPLRRIEAVYDATSGGFTVRATDGAATLGVTELFPGSAEVVLQFRLAAGTLFLEGGPTTGRFVNEFIPTSLHSEPLAVEGSTRQALAFGVEGLGKLGSLFVNQLTLGGILPDIGAVETPIAVAMSAAFDQGFNAGFLGTLATIVPAIEAMRSSLVDVTAQLEAGLAQDTLDAVTQGERALQNAEKALALAAKGKALGDKLLAAGSDKTKPVNRKARAALARLQLAFAQLAGFKSNSFQRIFRTGFLPFGF